MNETKSLTKWWWAWSPESLEKWLEEIEESGWHLQSVAMGGTRFRFKKDCSRHYRYCLDYQNKVGSEYLRIYEDAGWERVYQGMGWHIWRMEYEGARPEIYTDWESRIEHNQRLMGMLTAVFAAQIPLLVVNMQNDDLSSPFRAVLSLMYLFLISLLGFGVWRLSTANKELKNRQK
ncbi:MAG: DUF2812 domain-containing protein [Candidatus Saccharibacteria bacterium]